MNCVKYYYLKINCNYFNNIICHFEFVACQCSQNVDVNGPHHGPYQLMASSSLHCHRLVEWRRHNELEASMVGAASSHVLGSLHRTEFTTPPTRPSPHFRSSLLPHYYEVPFTPLALCCHLYGLSQIFNSLPTKMSTRAFKSFISKTCE